MSERTRVLAVDDNDVNLAILREIFEDGYELAFASTGEQAIETARTFRPDLVLLDIMMPGIDGYETCRRLRSDATTRYAKIILVSAKALVSERLMGYEAGADDYVTKPFDPEELSAKVRAVARLKFVEELDRFKSDMLTLLTHETRTPLTVIQGALDVVRSGAGESSGRERIVEMAVNSCERLSSLIERADLLCRLRSGQVQLQVESVPLQAAIATTLDDLRSHIEGRAVTVRSTVPEALAVHADPTLLTTVLTALVHNAVRFSPAHAAVSIEACRSGPNVLISVVDHGPGIADAMRATVFEELVPSDVGHHTEGQGLSLAICREIVRGHGGEIDLRSDPAETRFTLSWPAAEHSGTLQSSAPAR